jgi:hypothetical protein
VGKLLPELLQRRAMLESHARTQRHKRHESSHDSKTNKSCRRLGDFNIRLEGYSSQQPDLLGFDQCRERLGDFHRHQEKLGHVFDEFRERLWDGDTARLGHSTGRSQRDLGVLFVERLEFHNMLCNILIKL